MRLMLARTFMAAVSPLKTTGSVKANQYNWQSGKPSRGAWHDF
jgi:hypothetical protein